MILLWPTSSSTQSSVRSPIRPAARSSRGSRAERPASPSRKATVRLSHLRAEPLRNATQWLAGYREFWAESFDRLDELLATLQDDPKGAHHGRDNDDR